MQARSPKSVTVSHLDMLAEYQSLGHGTLEMSAMVYGMWVSPAALRRYGVIDLFGRKLIELGFSEARVREITNLVSPVARFVAVARVNGVPAGVLCWSTSNARMYAWGTWVARSARRMGVASALWDHAIGTIDQLSTVVVGTQSWAGALFVDRYRRRLARSGVRVEHTIHDDWTLQRWHRRKGWYESKQASNCATTDS